MKILHTSDWHLGRNLHGVSLIEAQSVFLRRLTAITATEQVDCVLVAGDVFDRAVPPVEAIVSYEQALADLSEVATVIVTSGNHDSPIRLGFAGRLLRSGIHIHTDPKQVGNCLQLEDEYGPVLIYPIPYLDPDHARIVLADSDEPLPRSHQAVMEAAIELIESDLRARQQRHGTEKLRSIVVAHAFVTGGWACDSERDISVGGVDAVSTSAFSRFDYVALGHLHRRQTLILDPPIKPSSAALESTLAALSSSHMPPACTRRLPCHPHTSTPSQNSPIGGSRPNNDPADGRLAYSGSPLRYSFSEESDKKSVSVITLDGSGVTDIRYIPIPQPREMATLTGSIDEILAPATVIANRDRWIRAVVTDDSRPDRMYERISTAFPHALSTQHQPRRGTETLVAQGLRESLTPLETFSAFIKEATNSDATAAELEILNEVLTIAEKELTNAIA